MTFFHLQFLKYKRIKATNFKRTELQGWKYCSTYICELWWFHDFFFCTRYSRLNCARKKNRETTKLRDRKYRAHKYLHLIFLIWKKNCQIEASGGKILYRYLMVKIITATYTTKARKGWTKTKVVYFPCIWWLGWLCL